MRNSLTILLVTYEFPPYMNTGGIGSYMLHLAHLLSSAGHRVTVFSATHLAGPVQKEDHIHYTNYLFFAPTQRDFRDAVSKFFHNYIRYNIVDLIESPEVGACALGIKSDYPHIPLIVKLHTPGVIITKISNTYQPITTKLRYVAGSLRRGKLDLGYWSRIDNNKENDPECSICMLADKLVSPSKALGRHLSRYWQLNKEISIIPNPFHADTDLYQYSLREREKLICFVGKLTVLKGMFALTKAINRILKKYPDYHVVFAGRDEAISETMPSMRSWMEQTLSDVLERVEFTGALPREKVKELLGKSRICVVPSLWENYPTVVLEAMAAGTAVAAANRGGIPEMIEDGKTGYLFDPLKPSAIAQAISRLIVSDTERQEMASAAREWVQSSQVGVEQRITDLFESLTPNNT